MIDVYHCPKCSRLLKCEGVGSIQGEELPVFSCDDCVVKRTVFRPDRGHGRRRGRLLTTIEAGAPLAFHVARAPPQPYVQGAARPALADAPERSRLQPRLHPDHVGLLGLVGRPDRGGFGRDRSGSLAGQVAGVLAYRPKRVWTSLPKQPPSYGHSRPVSAVCSRRVPSPSRC
jgi:hypothetical protein